MKQILLLLLTIAITTTLKAQENVALFNKPVKNGFVIYASNKNPCPVSIKIDLNVENLKAIYKNVEAFVVPGNNEGLKLIELTTIDTRERTRFSYNYHSWMGDISLLNYDSNYIYDLPFAKGKSFLVYQGYGGKFSHQNDNALDFTMPEGTELLAAREGVVLKVVQNNSTSCPLEECKKYNNYVIIYHPDGTFAMYAHIQLNGSLVKEGDIVKKGDKIAYSGNTGFTNGPHLHFSCYLPGIGQTRTFGTKFKINGMNEVGYLQEKTTYSKDY
jgi:murein DD-endopeptidase MepM/ murein hydrolase activator NlpD